MESIKKYKLLIIRSLVLVCSFTLVEPSAQTVFAAEKSNQSINYEVPLIREDLLDKYIYWDRETGLPLFDVNSAKKDNIDSKELDIATQYNNDMISILEEPSIYAGKNYFRKIRDGKYEIGFSSTTCKVVANGLKYGGKWIIEKLAGLIPGIGFILDYLVGWILDKGIDFLKIYSSSGLKIIAQKNMNISGWSFDCYRQ